MEITHQGTITIETERLILRRFELTDADAMFNNWANDEEVTKYLSWGSHGNIDNSISTISYWISQYNNNNEYNWCIALKETNEAIGSIGLVCVDDNLCSAGIGYALSMRYYHRSFKVYIKIYF